MISLVKSPAHWQEPASDKGSAAQEQKQLRPGKPDLPTPRDGDWHKAAKEAGVGFSNNPVSVLVRGDNPAAGSYRNPPEHKYPAMGAGGDSGVSRERWQNSYVSKRK